MKLIDALIERLAIVCVLITVAIFALFKPDLAARYLVEFLEGEYGHPSGSADSHRGEHPSRLKADSPQGENNLKH